MKLDKRILNLHENVKQLSDKVLLDQTNYIAEHERGVTILALRHLREVEIRRLFADFRQDRPYLRYLEVQKDGSQKNIELTPEQMAEPSESLIASLESDGQILGRARERVVSYQYGQKIQVREVDGKIYSFKVTQGNKTFSCNPDPQKHLNCSCSEQ